jgi:uncharacterized protein (TIGR02246 family)
MSTATRVDLKAEERAIRELVKKSQQAWAKKDARAVASIFAQDSAFLYPGRPLVSGQGALRDALAEFMRTPGFALSFEPARIDVAPAGDMAYELGTYRLAMDSPGGHVDQTGKYVTVWKKSGDRWEVAVDAPSADSER